MRIPTVARRTLTCLSALLLGTGIATSVAAAAPTAPAALTLPAATFAVSSDWGGGYGAAYTIDNPMTIPLSTWKVSFTLPAGDKVTSVWDGTLTTSGNTYTVTNASYNAPVAAGTSVSFGLNVSYTGASPTPGSCTLNGDPCNGSGDPVAPSTPANLAVLSTNSTSVALNWSASTDNIQVAGYTIYNGSGTKVGSSPGPVGSVTGLSPSTTYSFSVKRLRRGGQPVRVEQHDQRDHHRGRPAQPPARHRRAVHRHGRVADAEPHHDRGEHRAARVQPRLHHQRQHQLHAELVQRLLDEFRLRARRHQLAALHRR